MIIGLFIFTLLFIIVATKLLNMENHLRLSLFGIWSVLAFFFLPNIQAFFNLNIVNISISATFMIILGMTIRFLFINQLPKMTFTIIWSLISIRLLIPFSIPSRFSIWNVVENNQLTNEVSRNVMSATQLGQGYPPIEFIQETNISLGGIYFSIWIAGAIITSLYILISHYRFRQQAAESLPINNKFIAQWLKEHQLFRKIQVRQSEKISSPLTYGIFRPIILLPKSLDWQDESQLDYILAHEYVHIKKFDYCLKIIFAVTLTIHWFNPLVWVMHWLANRDIELACDETVLKIIGKKAKTSYAMTLLDMAENQHQLIMLYSNFSKHGIEERVKIMMKEQKISLIGAVCVVILIVATMIAFASPTIYANKAITNIDGVTEITADRLEVWQAYHTNTGRGYTEEEFQELVQELENGARLFFLGELDENYQNETAWLKLYEDDVTDVQATVEHWARTVLNPNAHLYSHFALANDEYEISVYVDENNEIAQLFVNGERSHDYDTFVTINELEDGAEVILHFPTTD